MNRIINWRYEKWDNNEKNNDKKYSEDDISDYISWDTFHSFATFISWTSPLKKSMMSLTSLLMLEMKV